MNRIFSLVLVFFCCQTFANVAPKPSPIMPLASKSLLLDITVVNNQTLVAVGQHGNIILSPDAIHWHQAKVPVQSTLTSVTFVGSEGWAVGHDAVILHSTDSGESWIIQQWKPEKQKPLLDVLFKNNKEGIAVGAYGQQYRTIDGGKTWSEEFHAEILNEDDRDYLNELKREDKVAYEDERASILPHFNRLVKDGVTYYLVGEIGLMAKSNDFGRTWQLFDHVYDGSFFDITRTNQGNLLAVGLRGHIFRSLKNGTPWKQISTETTALLNSIVLTDTDTLFVLGNNGVLLKSDNDGQDVQQLNQRESNSLIAGVWFKNQLVVASDVGIKIITVK